MVAAARLAEEILDGRLLHHIERRCSGRVADLPKQLRRIALDSSADVHLRPPGCRHLGDLEAHAGRAAHDDDALTFKGHFDFPWPHHLGRGAT